ncbi:MAG: zinc-ribbon domain-containing protein [Candidatus Hodarchaeota archaeon]
MNESNTGPKFARLLLIVIGVIVYVVIDFDLWHHSPSIFVIIGMVAFVAIIMIASSRLRRSSREISIPEPTTEFPRRRDDFPRRTESRSSERMRLSDVSCPDCGYENPSDAQFCIGCGRRLG